MSGQELKEVKIESFEELDILMAEILGKKLKEGQTAPNYSTSIELALKTLDKFKHWEITKARGGYRVMFYELIKTNIGNRRTDSTASFGKTLPLAICYVILESKGITVVG